MKKIILITILLSLVSCSTTKRTSASRQKEVEKMMNNWIGSSKHDLLLTWGSPKSVSSDGNNGEILTFEELKRAFLQSYGYVTVVHRYMFYVNNQSKVYTWRYDTQRRQGH